MKKIFSLESLDARAMVEVVENYARTKEWKISVVVVDDGGHVLQASRMDGVGPHTVEIAYRKAKSAGVTRRSTMFWEEKINEGRVSMLEMPVVFPVEGGEPILFSGQCLGGVGVSGVQSFEDAELARLAIDTVIATWHVDD